MSMALYKYEVGTLYHPGKTSFQEAGEYNYRSGAHELRLFWASPSAREVHAVQNGQIEVALLVGPPVLWFLYRIDGGCDWSDAPYTWHLLPPDQRMPPEPLTGEARMLLNVVLVDATTGLIRALRAATLSPAVSQALHAAIAEQMAAPWDAAAYDRARTATYARYPTSADMARAARWRGVAGA